MFLLILNWLEFWLLYTFSILLPVEGVRGFREKAVKGTQVVQEGIVITSLKLSFFHSLGPMGTNLRMNAAIFTDHVAFKIVRI